MRRLFAFAPILLSAAAASFSIDPSPPEHGERPVDLIRSSFREQRRGKGKNNRRGKGAVSRAKKRSNRLTISKRIRRKHRRAA